MEEVRKIILDNLPQSAKDVLEQIMKRLEEKGVEEVEDLKFIHFDSDFSDIIKDVPCRKFKAKMDIFFSNSSTDIVISSDQICTTNMAAEPSTPLSSSNHWFEDFYIELKRLPQNISSKLQKGQRLPPKEYRELVRIMVDEIKFIHAKPIKKHLVPIARNFIQQYPCMKDVIDDRVIGTGYDGLLRKLIARVENSSRPLSRHTNKKPLTSNVYSAENYYPGLTDEQFQLFTEKKKELNEENQTSNWNIAKVEELMIETFPLQRIDIINTLGTAKLKKEWPFLFISRFMIRHFNLLCNKDIQVEFTSVLNKKVPELYNFLQSEGFEVDIDNSCNFLQYLCAYFEEDFSKIMITFKAEESVNEICQLEDIPSTPFIAAVGNPLLSNDNCILIVEKESASEFIDFKTATLLWFVSFYVLDLKYPEDCEATAEFIQRAFFAINPEKGSKSKRKCKRTNVHCKVLSVVEKLCKFKSMWKM